MFLFTSYIRLQADSQYRACKGKIFALTKIGLSARLFQQNILDAVRVKDKNLVKESFTRVAPGDKTVS